MWEQLLAVLPSLWNGHRRAGSEMGKWEPDGEFICTVFCPHNVGTKQNWIQVLSDIAVFLLAAVCIFNNLSFSPSKTTKLLGKREIQYRMHAFPSTLYKLVLYSTNVFVFCIFMLFSLKMQVSSPFDVVTITFFHTTCYLKEMRQLFCAES